MAKLSSVPRAQTAWICTSTRTFCGRVIPERTSTTTRLPARRAVARTEPRVESEGGRFVRNATAVEKERTRSPARQAWVSRSFCRSFSRTFLTRQAVASPARARRPAAAASAV